ncbi:MAG: response regulator [Balneolaceae bacterium]|nr:response regulator [Balneolaceae bacterium]
MISQEIHEEKHQVLPEKTIEQPAAHILLVEDNREMADYVTSLLEDHNYQVSCVINGKKALVWLDENVPDLIISDVMMPVMDGIELLSQIKQRDHLRLIPVIFLSAKTDIEGRMEGFRLGVNDYIHKPFVPDELMVRVANLLEFSENRKNAIIEYEETEPNNWDAAESPDEERLSLIRELVESHITDGNFNLDAIASDVAMSKSTLYRFIKKETGLSAGNFVKEVRLQQARELLENKQVKTVKETSLAVGYNHSGYFSKQFYERFGFRVSDLL